MHLNIPSPSTNQSGYQPSLQNTAQPDVQHLVCHTCRALKHYLGDNSQEAIQKPFEARDLGARTRLITLLKRLTIRASKVDLIMLVKCHRKASHSYCLFLQYAKQKTERCLHGLRLSYLGGQAGNSCCTCKRSQEGVHCAGPAQLTVLLTSIAHGRRWYFWTLRHPTQPATTSS